MTSIGSGSALPSVEKTTDQNPYTKVLNNINLAAFPDYTELVGKVLAVFGCIYAFTAIICITVLLIPLRRGPEVRKNLFWLLRKRYVSSTSTPYHVMNSGLVVAISQLLSSLVFVAYVFLNYWSLNSKCFILRAYLHVCWELCLWVEEKFISFAKKERLKIILFSRLPAYFGFHVTAFSSLYTCLSSPKYTAKRRSVFAHPFFLNLLFYALPVFVTLQTIGWSIALALAVISEEKVYKALVAELEQAAANWFVGQALHGPRHRQVMSLLGKYLNRSKYFMFCWIWSSRTWSIIGLALAIFYAINVANLLSLLRNSLKTSRSPTRMAGSIRSGPVQQLGTRESPESINPRIEAPTNTLQKFSSSIQAQASIKALRNGYIYLIVHCSIMLLDLLIHVTCGIIRTVHAERAILDKRWRSKTTLLVLLGSTLASLAMLFHSWRVFTEREDTQGQDARFRNYLISNGDDPNLEARNSSSVEMSHHPEQQITDQSEMCSINCHGISASNTPVEFWSINPVRLGSPVPFTGLGVIKTEKSIEMSPIDHPQNDK